MVENAFKDLKHQRRLGFDETRITGGGQLLQNSAQTPGIGHGTVKVAASHRVPLHERTIAIKNQLFQQF